MPTFPAKTNYASGDILTAAQMVDVGNGLNDLLPDAKGSLTTVSAANTPAQLTVGANGETLVADSSQTTGLRYNPPVASLGNVFVNGGMDVWQRGTSVSVAASTTVYTADQWRVNAGANQNLTISRQSVSDSTNLPNIQYALRFQRNSGQTGTSNINCGYSVENANFIPYAGKTVTLSYYARKGTNYSQASDALGIVVQTGTGVDENYSSISGTVTLLDTTITLTATWQRFVHTFTLGATARQLFTRFRMTPVGTAGADDWYEVTGVQLDVGTWTASTAPTFRRAGGNIAGELAACQRYYYRIGASSTNQAIASGFATSTTSARGVLSYPVTMRVTPTALEQSGVVTDYEISRQGPATVTCSAVPTFGNGTAHSGFFVFTVASGLTAGEGVILRLSVANSYLAWSAEL